MPYSTINRTYSTINRRHSRFHDLALLLLAIVVLPSSSAFSHAPGQATALIRPFRPEDATSIAQLFHDTVRTVNLGDYSQLQVEAWAPDDLDFRNWAEACADRFTVVAEAEEGTIGGFAELQDDGHIDCFYCHQDYQRRGIGRLLYTAIEQQAQSLGLDDLTVEASITSKPFFERMGFSSVQEQTVSCRGQSFINYKMEKTLGGGQTRTTEMIR